MIESKRQPMNLQHHRERHHRKRRRKQEGILKPTSHSSRRYVPCSFVVFGVPITVKTVFLGIIQLLLPISMCRMGYSIELTFGDWILRVLMIFTFTLVLLLLLVDATLSSSSSNSKSACRIQITPAERKRRLMSAIQSSPYQKIVSFAKGTKFFRLPRPKSKRQLLREQQELQQNRQEQDSRSPHPTSQTTPNRYPTLAGMTPPPPTGFANTEVDSTPDWKRAHRLLRAAMREPPAHKHSDDREDYSSQQEGRGRDVREDHPISRSLFHHHDHHHCDGFDADSERDDDDTGDNLSATVAAHARSSIDEDEDDSVSRKSSVLGTIGDDEDSMILFEDDDDTYDETIQFGTHSCYSPLRTSESEDTLEEELEEALVETIEHLSPTRLCI